MATAYLELRGWTIVERNARWSGVEVDLLADDGSARVIVEVKFRGRSDYGGAALAVDHAQRARLMRAAGAVAARDRRPVRIDLIAIELNEDGATLRHYRNAIAD